MLISMHDLRVAIVLIIIAFISHPLDSQTVWLADRGLN